jgi:hypothetical protein
MFEQDIRSTLACRRKGQRTCLRRDEDDVTCEGFEMRKKRLPVYRVIPRIATAAEPMMRGARRPVRAANQAPEAIPMLANTYGGMVILGVLFRRKVTRRYWEVNIQLRFPSRKSQVGDDRRLRKFNLTEGGWKG